MGRECFSCLETFGKPRAEREQGDRVALRNDAAFPDFERHAFLGHNDADAITAHLASCGVAIEVGPVQRAGSRGAMTSVYCRDPDGSLLEFITYPEAR